MKLELTSEAGAKRKAVAITFDDGPNPEYTPQILDIFREYGGKATFFVIGRHVQEHMELAGRIHEEGHELGNHTYTHPYLTRISEAERWQEIEKTDRLIAEVTGASPVSMRPPYLDFNEDVAALSVQFGYAMIGALNMKAQDWDRPGVDHILKHTREQVKNGSILIFHDGFGDRSDTVQAVRTLVQELAGQGYELVTVRELLQ